MASTTLDPAQSAAFDTWAAAFIPQVFAIIGAPNLDSMDKVFDQYSSITRTSSIPNSDLPNEFSDHAAMKTGFLRMIVETYCSTLFGAQMGPFDVRKVWGGSGAVTVVCTKEVGEVEEVVAIWSFVRKTG